MADYIKTTSKDVEIPKVFFVGAGPGEPELLTLKAKRLLDEADVVLYTGSLINPQIVENLKAELYDTSSMTLDEIMDIIFNGIRSGKKVVRLHTGDPSFYSSISEQIWRLKLAGIRYEVVPGVSSASAAAAELALELTVPELSQAVIFCRAEGRTPVPETQRLKELAAHRATMVIFLSVSMINKVVDELIQGGYSAKTPVAVVYKASWPECRIIRGTLEDIAEQIRSYNITRTAIIIVGDVLKESLKGSEVQSRLYSKQFSHSYRCPKPLKGKLMIVGIGPGAIEHMTEAARDAIREADTIVGYTSYVQLIKPLIHNKEIITTGMTQEIQRCKIAIETAKSGKKVALVSGGDPGIYALAGLVLELITVTNEDPDIEIEMIPGMPAFSACAAKLGAPLMHDFAVISLSDRLTPWEKIEQRIEAAAKTDYVIVLYNPQSRSRKDYLKKAFDIVLRYRSPDTPVGIVKAATRANERTVITTLGKAETEEVDMQTTVIIGNSTTFVSKGMMITPRGYSNKYDYLKSKEVV